MLKENLQRVKGQISDVCARININPDKIIVICVTKGRSIAQIQEAINLGLINIGENKVQEAQEKCKQISGVKWHMIGHLQSNKVKAAVKIFDLIHSVDSVSLAYEIDKQAAKINKVQSVLLEVKTSLETTKFGFLPQVLTDACEQVAKLKNINIKGLMTIAPVVSNVKKAAAYFALLRQLRDQLNPQWCLSMGMSDDFQVAIEEGADMIRVGRAIFSR